MIGRSYKNTKKVKKFIVKRWNNKKLYHDFKQLDEYEEIHPLNMMLRVLSFGYPKEKKHWVASTVEM